jgi:radical SAM-linked protein
MIVETGGRPVAARAVVDGLDRFPAGRGPVPNVKAVFDRFSLEIARGCAEGCRFCQAGFLYRPVRERSVEQAALCADRAVVELGFDEISLASLSSADHSRIEPLVAGLGEQLTPLQVSLSVPSLRAYGLPGELVEVLARLRATGVTLAPEAGSQRLRDAVNKNVTEDDIRAAAARFFDRGFKRIKLYFMLGLPGETDRDLEEIVLLAAGLRDLGRQRLGGRSPAVVASVSTFVPKPFTPFEREAMIDIEEIERRQRLLITAGRRARVEVRTHDPRLSRLEGIFSRGGVELATVLERALDAGARFDGWGDKFDGRAWDTALDGLDLGRALAAIPDGSPVPWGHVDTGLDPAFLRAERDLSRDAVATPPCGLFAGADGGEPELECHACGIGCAPEDLPLRRSRIRAAAPAEAISRPVGRRGPPGASDTVGGVEPTRVRLFLAGWGRQAFVGHLDTVRQVVRCLRRAGLRPYYTRGFHPKPKLQSGPALPLGTVGLAEPFDVWLADPPAADEILERLCSCVPADMEFAGARQLSPDEPGLSRAVTAADYVVLARVERSRAREAVERLLAAESLEIARVRKGRERLVDVRPFLLEAALLDGPPTGLRLPPTADRTAISLALAVTSSGGTRPTELLEPLLTPPDLDAWIVRTGLRGS